MLIIQVLMLIGVLTLICLGSILTWSFYCLWKTPPSIYISLIVPDEFKLISQRLPSNIETDKPTEVPIPIEVLEYISLESESSAQDARKRRARELYRDTQDWKSVFRLIQQEDTQVI